MKKQQLQAHWMNFLKIEFRWSLGGAWAISSIDMFYSKFEPFLILLILCHCLSQSHTAKQKESLEISARP